MLKVDDDALIHSSRFIVLKETVDKALRTNQTDIYLGKETRLEYPEMLTLHFE